MNDDSPLKLQGITKNYQEFHLGPIDLEVPRGYVMGLVGANGAGKTTAIKAMLGMVGIDAGSISVLDGAPGARHGRIGVVLDRLALSRDWTAVSAARSLERFYPDWDRDLLDDLLTRLDVPARVKIKDLSRGQGVKLALALALAHSPELLILDEPTSGLDPVARLEVLDIFRDFLIAEGRTVLFSTHITSDLDRIADMVTILDAGRVIASGSREDLLETWVMVRGGVADLTDGLNSRVRGLRRHSVGWEGLLPAADLGLCGPGVVAETPSIEELLVHLAKERKDA